MTLLRRIRSASLLIRFGVISLLVTIAVGAALSSVLSNLMAERARERAESAVTVTVHMGLQPQLTRRDLVNGFDPDRLARVERAAGIAAADLAAGSAPEGLDPIELKIFNRDRTVVYHSKDRSVIGTTSNSAGLIEALQGRVVSGFANSTDDSGGDGDRQLFEVYVPVYYQGSTSPDGVMELYLPYAPVAAAVREDVRTLQVALSVGLAVFYVVVFRLIASASKRLRRQAQALQASADRDRHTSTHDALTQLPNWVLLRDRLDQSLAAVTRTTDEVALLLIDLDRFKEINDTLGHSYGDKLLQQVGPRLQSVLREGDTVGRLGGDEFAVVLPSVDGAAEAQSVAERLRAALHRPFDVDGVILDVEASIGIALSPWHGTSTEDLLRNADIAMYAAKELKTGTVVFEPGEHDAAPNRLTVLGDLRRALDNEGELFLHYQPKITLDGERIEGVEALLRWQHPSEGLVPPDTFIPVAEGTGIILRLTERVLQLALAQERRWLDEGHGVPVAVNLSTRCLLDADLPDMVGRLLAVHGVPAQLLRLEVTESAVMGDGARCMAVLQRLRDLGVRLSIDDFGTGYSSMAYLRRLPVDELKIDRSFVMGMTTDPQDAVLVRTAIDLGHNLGLTVVAEGVEGAEHVAALRELGCDIAQGYHFARPMPADALTELMARVGTLYAESAQSPSGS
jgi:diguanylate cyclase (GGDEF)-like protein